MTAGPPTGGQEASGAENVANSNVHSILSGKTVVLRDVVGSRVVVHPPDINRYVCVPPAGPFNPGNVPIMKPLCSLARLLLSNATATRS